MSAWVFFELVFNQSMISIMLQSQRVVVLWQAQSELMRINTTFMGVMRRVSNAWRLFVRGMSSSLDWYNLTKAEWCWLVSGHSMLYFNFDFVLILDSYQQIFKVTQGCCLVNSSDFQVVFLATTVALFSSCI